MNQPTRPPMLPMVLTGMLCTVVLVVFARAAYGLVLPAMREGLGLSYAEAANLGTVTALGYLTLVMVAGAFAARWGGRLSIILGLSLACVGFVGLALFSHYLIMVVMMLMLGFGTAFGYTPLISLLGTWYPERRGAAIGLANGGVGLGMVIAGAVVPWLTTTNPDTGWRTVWWLFAAAALGVAVVVSLILKNPPRHVDNPDKPQILPAKSAVYRNAHVINVGVIYGIIGVTYIVQTIFMFSFALASGIPALTAGKLASTMGLLSIMAGPAWGWVSDRIGRSNALVICMSLSALGMALPVISPTLPAFTIHYVILGLCISGLFTSVLAACTETVHPRLAPVAVSFITFFFAAGQLVGPAAAGLLIESTGNFRDVFGICAALMGVAIYLCWYTRKSQQRMMVTSTPG